VVGSTRVGELYPEQFCRHNFVFKRTYDDGFCNEMYRILTATAWSLLLNWSLIIGENMLVNFFSSFIVQIIMRIDDFQRPTQTGVLYEGWRECKEPIVW